MRKMILLSAGLLASFLGSGFTGLAMSAWVFQNTGSATQYGLTLLCNLLPGTLAGPVAGALVDRWNRWAILVVSEAVSAAAILGLALLAGADALRPWHIFVVVAVQSVVRSMQLPALSAAVVTLTTRDQVSRANGLIVLAQALGNTAGFAGGGLLLVTVQLQGVLLIDVATFLANIVILLFVPIPRPTSSETGSTDGGRGLLAEVGAGCRVFTSRRALVVLLIFVAALNVTVGSADAMLTPLVLSFASAAVLGAVVASMGVGAILGGSVLTVWGGPRRRIVGLAGFALPLGLFLCVAGAHPSIPLIVVAALGFTFCYTIVDGTARNVLQLEIEPDMQGRAFATFSVVGGAALALAYLVTGSVADDLAEPSMRPGGQLAMVVGPVIGTGPGRGMALIMVIVGILMLTTAVAATLYPGLRGLPDRPAKPPELTSPEPVQPEEFADRAGESSR